MKSEYHRPVLLKEMLEFLDCRPGRTYVDATLGGGGWAEAILEASSPDGILIGCDRDDDAIEESKKRLRRFGKRFIALKTKFSEISGRLAEVGVSGVNGITADLGVSSHQIDDAERGFSFIVSGRLDMRMDRSSYPSAFEIVNRAPLIDLEKWFFEFGEERFSRRIARAIVAEREKNLIEKTSELARLISAAVPSSALNRRIHPATRVFQAIRMVVNDEVVELKSLLCAAPKMLVSGGRFVVVSYHSIEDREVKSAFAVLEKEGEFKRLIKKPVRPAPAEISENRRARSARMRVIEKR